MIIPPTDIRNVIDKTAAFITKTGPEYEDKIKEKERHNPLFSFLNLHDPYHAYYRMRREELTAGGPPALEALQVEMQARQQQADGQETQDKREVGKAPPEPEPLHFTLDLPNIAPLDLYAPSCLHGSCGVM